MFRALITVAGTPLPEPSTYSGSTITMVDSGRNTQGVYIGSVIRDDVAKVEATWRFLTVKEWSMINKLFKRNSNGGKFINSVTFFDQTEGKFSTREMYVSDRTAGMFRRDPDTGEVVGWTGCRISLVEV